MICKVKKIFIWLVCLSLVALLASCDRFGEANNPSPTPLEQYKATAQVSSLWSTSIGSGDSDSYLRFSLALNANSQFLFVVDSSGTVTAVDAKTGRNVWQNQLNTSVTSGIGEGEGVVVIGAADSTFYGLDEKTGKTLWTTTLDNQALAASTVIKGVVLVKTVDDQVYSLDAKTGKTLWTFSTGAPQLILRLGSSPKIVGDKVVIGLASGKVFVVSLSDGAILWEQAIAIPSGATEVQQMVDIDVTPMIQDGVIYIASYQGNIAALQLTTGVTLWHRQLSSYTGLVLMGENLFITDADSHLWLLRKKDGMVKWQQDKLAYRNLTAPVIVKKYVVVGDVEGYLQFLSSDTGELVGRVQVSSGVPILSAPIVQGNVVYVLSCNGKLAAYQVN